MHNLSVMTVLMVTLTSTYCYPLYYPHTSALTTKNFPKRLRYRLEMDHNLGIRPSTSAEIQGAAVEGWTADKRDDIYMPDAKEYEQQMQARSRFGFGLGKRSLQLVPTVDDLVRESREQDDADVIDMDGIGQ
ncbi:hypothetical protein BV898_07752 [Hypsibius exemplaris]|uniref:Cardio acceleratory peptide 2b n=1 Tax=Hypsibius exemplaris TaxID=2072580 RepID=A0A1W0WSN6_HYPEX|nr:hypothetical protein BV898_07752 [Hypsibius exemplaris]